MIVEQTIKWQPFSEKHKQYIKNALKNTLNVAEGAIRSGKTIDHCIVAAAYLEQSADKIHLASGSTLANAKLNIGECNGYGLEYIFRGRCKWGKFKDNEALYIRTQTGDKVLIFVGGGKADSYKKILGNSYGLWIATEINEHYDSNDSRTSFIKVAQGRQLAAVQPLTLWDLNPCAPQHPIYSQYIDKWKGDYPGGYQYEHFTIADNLSISAERRAEIERKYDKESVWYKRDILGMRLQAEGVVFPAIADNPHGWDIDAADVLDGGRYRLRWTEVGFDIGGNGSAYALTATAERSDGALIVLKSQKVQAADQSMDDLERLVDGFCADVERRWGRVRSVNCDHVAVVVNSINDHTQYRAELCYKPPLEDRPFAISKLLAARRLLFVKGECEDLLDELRNLVFDDRSERAIPLDDGSMQIDTWDSFIYSISGNWNYITL